MRVLVTGGAGFLGSHVVDLLLHAGHKPFVMDDLSSGNRENIPRGVPVFRVDIRDATSVRDVFRDVQPHAVCLYASQFSVRRSVSESAFDAHVNVVGLLNLLEESVRCNVRRIVFASSGAVLYGDTSTPVAEETACRPIAPHAISTWAGEQYLEFFAREHGITAVALRFSNVYGPRQNAHGEEGGVVAVFCERMLRNLPARIHGDGHSVRDYLFVTDASEAGLLALTVDLPQCFVPLNVGTGIGTDVLTLETQIRVICGSFAARRVPFPEFGPSRPGDLRSSLLDPRHAREVLGWKPVTHLTRGLSRTAEWFASEICPIDPGKMPAARCKALRVS